MKTQTTLSSARRLLLSAAISAIATTGALAQSAQIAALSGDATLTLFDSSSLKATAPIAIKGVNGRVVGIDRRPSDGVLYAVTADGTVYTVDAGTGQATQKVKLENMLPAGVMATVDFNPAADRLRLLGSDGTSLRANVDDGKVTVDGRLKYAEGDKAAGKPAKIVAGAYTNSVKGTKETTLYDIDGALGTYLRQAPPNDGILVTIGETGLKGEAIAFDILTSADGRNVGFALNGGTLHSLDVATGAAKAIGKVAGLPADVRDIAVMGN